VTVRRCEREIIQSSRKGRSSDETRYSNDGERNEAKADRRFGGGFSGSNKFAATGRQLRLSKVGRKALRSRNLKEQECGGVSHTGVETSVSVGGRQCCCLFVAESAIAVPVQHGHTHRRHQVPPALGTFSIHQDSAVSTAESPVSAVSTAESPVSAVSTAGVDLCPLVLGSPLPPARLDYRIAGLIPGAQSLSTFSNIRSSINAIAMNL
jgi:hypothetical protein